MNRDFVQLMLEKCNYSEDAKAAVNSFMDTVVSSGLESDIDAIIEHFRENEYKSSSVRDDVKALSEKIDVSIYTSWLVIIMLSGESAIENFRKKDISDDIFWATFEDLRFKAQKCKNIHGVWGIFVPFWYSIFCRAEIVKLGCLEFENKTYTYDEPYVFGDIVINKEDRIKGVHIPASGEPFTAENRMRSYKLAYEFFARERNGGPLLCKCSSWLLYPEYKKILPENSNIRSFMDDFDIVRVKDEDHFGDIWRVFGPDKNKPHEELPENTSLQRAFKKHLLNGGKCGEGVGVLIFDGEKIINNKK